MQLVVVGDLEAEPLVPNPLGDGDSVLLELVLVNCSYDSSMEDTYCSVVDAVDAGVGDIAQLGALVLNRVDAQETNLLECPATDATGELFVPRLYGCLLTRTLNLGVEPLVLESLGGSNNGEASRVTRLEGRDEVELFTGGEHLVDDFLLLLLVVDVGGARRLDNRGQLWPIAKDVADRARECDDIVLAAGEVVLGTGLVLGRGLQEQDIVVVGSAGHIVVEVVDHETGSLGGDVDIELEKGGVQGGGHRVGGAEGHQDVTTGIEEVKDQLRGQVGTKAWNMVLSVSPSRPQRWGNGLTLGLDGEEDDVIISLLA